jgi:hypothetical protein
MYSTVDSLIMAYLMDAEAILRRRLANLPEEARSEDPEIAEDAMEEAEQILRWLPVEPSSIPEERADAIMADKSRPLEERIKALQRAAKATIVRGRPRSTDSLLEGNRALLLRYGLGWSWRRVALEVGGCRHKGREQDASCKACGQRVRKSAERLQRVLELAGYDVRRIGEIQGPENEHEEMIKGYVAKLSRARE